MIDLKQTSIRVIKENQASTGAYVASPTFSQYGYSWLRDGMWIAYSMDVVGETASATAFHRWVAHTIQRYEVQINMLLEKIARHETIAETDYLPTRFTVNSLLGSDDWTDFQLDGYGAWLWGVVKHSEQYHPDLWTEVRPAVALLVRYLEALWQSPNYDCWEEFRHEIHIATLAAIYGGLHAVQQYDSELVPAGLPERIRDFTLTHGVSPDGHFIKFLGNENVDASLLWVALPFGLVELDDARFKHTLRKIEQDIHRPSGGVYRYCADTYFGGGEWLILTCYLAWVYIHQQRIEEARRLFNWVEQKANSEGLFPEQTAEYALDPSYYQPWVDRWGTSACPLLWSHAMYLVVQSELNRVES